MCAIGAQTRARSAPMSACEDGLVRDGFDSLVAAYAAVRRAERLAVMQRIPGFGVLESIWENLILKAIRVFSGVLRVRG